MKLKRFLVLGGGCKLWLAPLVLGYSSLALGATYTMSSSGDIPMMDGAYSFVVMSSTKLIAARDPHGFHPLCVGQRADGSIMFAS